MRAVEYKALTIIDKLLEKGANPNIGISDNGPTSLIFACSYKHDTTILKRLLSAGADIEPFFIVSPSNNRLPILEIFYASTPVKAAILEHLSTLSPEKQKSICETMSKSLLEIEKRKQTENAKHGQCTNKNDCTCQLTAAENKNS